MITARLGVREAARVILAGFGLRNLVLGMRRAAADAVVAIVILPIIIIDRVDGIGAVVAAIACLGVAGEAACKIVTDAFDDPVGRLRTEMRFRKAYGRVTMLEVEEPSGKGVEQTA